METGKLKKFAQFARRSLVEQVTAKLKIALADESPARRESLQAIKKLEKAVTDQGKEQVIEQVAYIWFNRFCALRFMDVNRYNRIGIVSPAGGQFQPEILADAKMGHIDDEMVSEPIRQKIFALLNGKTPSQDPQGEAYRLLVVAACNYWHSAMPFLFERIDDYTELLMPDDLLSGNSVLAYTREAMTPDACEDVEVIGWLYQFYISEKKDQVFADLKKNKKVTPENIPAATQLFTPHWIVRYLVENSLGRLWMLNRPDSGLIKQMGYYIQPEPVVDGDEQPETDFLRISSPEEIKICDPACGSGHMLTYAFDLLYAIYEEEGYEPADIPVKILTQNLYGIEIDERAGELAAFALTMKARAKQRRFFRKPVQPNVVVLANVAFTESEMQDISTLVGKALFTDELRETLSQFEQARNLGSLIVPKLREPAEIMRALEAQDYGSDMLLKVLYERVMEVLRMVEVLSPRYHVVVANPPYMGRGGANEALSSWTQKQYPKSRADLYAMFIERCGQLSIPAGFFSMITMHGWMFLSTFEKLRRELLLENHIVTMAHLGERAFDSIGGAVVSTAAFVFEHKRRLSSRGTYIRLVEGGSEQVKRDALIDASNNENSIFRFTASSNDFNKISSAPVAYWVSPRLFSLFEDGMPIKEKVISRDGLNTGNNELFIRQFWEVPLASTKSGAQSAEEFWSSGARWAPLIKGGPYRKWYGNLQHVITYDKQGFERLARSGNKLPSREFYFRECFSWTRISSPAGSFRYYPEGAIFESASLCVYSDSPKDLSESLAFSNSNLAPKELAALSPTVNLLSGYFDMLVVPPLGNQSQNIIDICGQCIDIARSDWDAYETSWDFTRLPLLNPNYHQPSLDASYQNLRTYWREMAQEMRRLEEDNNRIFIDAYSLQDELAPDVPLEDITLTCNPHYRYGNNKSEEELEVLLLADTMRELVSYAVGCMFGRYALEEPGLILANKAEAFEDFLKLVPEPSFLPDEDNIIPILDGDWFTDDITERFREFLRIAFGEEHYGENLRFVEQALGKDIRKYFLKDFYNDHVRRYKKRPIYWLFSSPRGSFNALIYMHRYQPHTVGTVLEYLRDFKDEKLKARKNHLEAVSISAGASQGEKTKALKEIEKINKIFVELDDYERDVLYPLATKQVEIELDNGVKANYPRFGDALKKIPGLS